MEQQTKPVTLDSAHLGSESFANDLNELHVQVQRIIDAFSGEPNGHYIIEWAPDLESRINALLEPMLG